MVWNLLWWSGTHTHNIPWGNACAINTKVQTSLGLPWWLSGRALACQCRRLGFYPCVRKIPEKDNGSPLQYSRPGKSVGPQISFPFTRCVSTIVLQLYGTDEEEMLRERGGGGGATPNRPPDLPCSPHAGNLGSSCEQLNGVPPRITGKVTQTQRETNGAPQRSPGTHSRGETRQKAGGLPEQTLQF